MESPLPVRWSSPEVLDKRKFSFKSDIWSFGIVCYEIFSEGAIPFPYLNNKECMREIIEKNLSPDKPKKCKQDLWNVISSCFKAKPDDRPTASELYELLKSFQKQTSNGTDYVLPPSSKKEYDSDQIELDQIESKKYHVDSNIDDI